MYSSVVEQSPFKSLAGGSSPSTLNKKSKILMFVSEILIKDFHVLMPEFFMVMSICLLLVYGGVQSTHIIDSRGSPILGRSVLWLSVQVLVLTVLLVVNGDFASTSLCYGSLIHDSLTINAKMFILSFGAFCLISSQGYLRAEGLNAFEYSILILLSLLGMILMLSSADLLSLYLGVELQSLCLYVLACFKRGSGFSTEAGLKYFVMGAFSSGLLLFGSSLVYGFTGTTSYESLARLMEGSSLVGVEVGLLLISVSLLFKMAAGPFHMWAPDVYEGSPSSTSMFFATVPKMALVAVLVRLYYGVFYDLLDVWQSLLVFSSVCSLIVGVLGALYQRKVKRFLAFSSIGHVGYLLIGLTCGSLEGVQSVLLYTMIYMVMSLNIWTLVLCTRNELHGGPLKYIDEFTIVGRQNPYLGLTLIMGMFSMAGIPPLGGFCAKMYVFLGAMESSMFGLALFAVLMSVIGAFYYLRWVKIIFFENKVLEGKTNVTVFVDREKSLILGCTSLFICFFFSYPTPLLLLTHNMALNFCFLLSKAYF